MAWLYSCAIWISLINILAHSYGAINTTRHLHRRTRAAQRNNDLGSIVFPGLSNFENSFKPGNIPKECENYGICGDVPEYPYNYVVQLIEGMSKINETKFNVDVLEPQIAQRLGPEEDFSELCRSEESLFNPKAAKDSKEQWYYILNVDKNVQQTYRVNKCHKQNVQCKPVVHFAQGYQGMCKQKYILRSMIAIDYNGKLIEKHFSVPSCCSCVYRVTDL